MAIHSYEDGKEISPSHAERTSLPSDEEDIHDGDGLNADHQPDYRDKETKRILRKVDFRLLPMLTLLYVLAFLDRGNIGNAKIAGMSHDLKLTTKQYNMALTVFFFPYAILEVPSNVVLKLMKPSSWICILMLTWGGAMIGQGFVRNYQDLLLTRVLLGIFESGFFPAASYLLTTWYCRFEVQTRLAVFFSAASMAGAFSGLLAFAIQKMDGAANIAGWRWIFILEGVVTVAIGVTLPWTLPDSPSTASFLTEHEKLFINHRLEEDSGTSLGKVSTKESFQWKYLTSALTEWKIYLAVIVYYGNSISLYGFTYSAPTIILSLGYTASNAQLLTIPIYVLGVISTIFFSVVADRHQKRWPYIVIPYSIAVCGFLALLVIPHPRFPGLTYAFLFTIPAGVYPPLICCLSWIGNNLAPTWKRSVGMALLISIGNFGGAIGSNIFIQAPRYYLGYGMGLAMCAAAIICTFILRFAFLRANKQRDKLDQEEIKRMYTTEQLIEMGDRSPLYRYVV